MRIPTEKVLQMANGLKKQPLTIAGLILLVSIVIGAGGLAVYMIGYADTTSNKTVKIHETKFINNAHPNIKEIYPTREELKDKFNDLSRQIDVKTKEAKDEIIKVIEEKLPTRRRRPR